jgi:transcriptional regulator with XRE-family HTH domain
MRPMREGQEIKHAIYGFGRVVSSDDERTLVHFQGVGRKLFVTSMMSALLVNPDIDQNLPSASGRSADRYRNGAIRGQSPAKVLGRKARNAQVDERKTMLRLEACIEKLRLIEEHRFLRRKLVEGIGDRIKHLRRQRGLLKVQLHRRARIALTSLEYYERGVRKPPIWALRKIASVLRVKVASFQREPDAVAIRSFRRAWVQALLRATRVRLTDTERASILK